MTHSDNRKKKSKTYHDSPFRLPQLSLCFCALRNAYVDEIRISERAVDFRPFNVLRKCLPAASKVTVDRLYIEDPQCTYGCLTQALKMCRKVVDCREVSYVLHTDRFHERLPPPQVVLNAMHKKLGMKPRFELREMVRCGHVRLFSLQLNTTPMRRRLVLLRLHGHGHAAAGSSRRAIEGHRHAATQPFERLKGTAQAQNTSGRPFGEERRFSFRFKTGIRLELILSALVLKRFRNW